MRALTVQQPWAWAIIHGGKLVENRTANWSYRGPLAIHAGLRDSDRGWNNELIHDAYIAADYPVLDLGAILGVVDLVDVHPDAGCCRPWGESAYTEGGDRERRAVTHLVLENPRALAEPIECKGALGLWTPRPDVVEALAFCPATANGRQCELAHGHAGPHFISDVTEES